MSAAFDDEVQVTGFKGVAGAVPKVVLKGFGDDRKGEIVPGNFIFIEEPGFETFFTGVEIQILERRSEEHIDLGDMGQAEQSVKAFDVYPGVGFFHSFS